MMIPENLPLGTSTNFFVAKAPASSKREISGKLDRENCENQKSIRVFNQEEIQLEQIQPSPQPVFHPLPRNQKAKSVEISQKATGVDEILSSPEEHVGSVNKHTEMLWVFEGGKMVYRPVIYTPGLYKILDKVLLNAADNIPRDQKMKSIKVNIDAEENIISVYNDDGVGIPVEIDQKKGLYKPELIFGHFEKIKISRNRSNVPGAKLANIFSSEFIIEIADGKRKKHYKQVFSDNMKTRSEPIITNCKAGESWTRVTFKPDLARFSMTHLEADVVALMTKRVIDLAGCLGKIVEVEFNGDRIPVASFSDYVKLYIKPAAPRLTEKVNDRWEICISLSEGQFQQVSFVNRIATIKGGTHVDCVTNQVSNYIMNLVNKKNKNANLKAHTVKNHLWIFVNALIDNPSFDARTSSENLKTRQATFEKKCELSQEFLKRVAKSAVVENLLSRADFKENEDPKKKTDGRGSHRALGIYNFHESKNAGSSTHAEKCTLILTEGNSAKALAMAGLSVLPRHKRANYGVYPLRGKPLNVKKAGENRIGKNKQINDLIQILGLVRGRHYEDVRDLYYGQIMLMADQDHDGSHMKGLLMNLIHTFWPSLLKIPKFLVEFITPIVKVTHRKNKNVISFYSMPEYEKWLESLGWSSKGWDVKYYKGLGTSTSKEGREYFSDTGKHTKEFVWQDERDGKTLEMAFGNDVKARKSWIKQFEPGTFLDPEEKLIKYSDFVNKELIQFSIADLQRSIPAMVDGLKPGQRKILFCCFKRNFTKEAKVAQFCGYVAEHSAYHHGEACLADTIIGMAQDFVGSNNINLLQPNGQFGTRDQGGKDSASARYTYTCLSPITRFLFPKEDDELLEYSNEDGQSIEPKLWYVPIIPTVLVNGCKGVGTGWSTFIPNYNPRDIVANVKRLINGEPMVPMDPWYKGFKGTIRKDASTEGGYTVTGVIEKINETTLRVSELPVGRSTQEYKAFLESMLRENDKFKAPFIKEYSDDSDDTSVCFEVILSEENLGIAEQDGYQKFKLSKSLRTNNMHLFGPDGEIKKYDTPEQVIKDFYGIRLELYEKRKRVLLENLELELKQLENRVRFILAVLDGEIVFGRKKRKEVYIELQQKGFALFPPKAKNDDSTSKPEDDDSSELPSDDEQVLANGYAYLLSMGMLSQSAEDVEELFKEKEKLEDKLSALRKAPAESLWLQDIEAFEKELEKKDAMDLKAEEEKKQLKLKVMKDAGMSAGNQAPNTEEASTSASVPAAPTPTMNIDDASEAPKPKGRGPKKAPGKAAPLVDTGQGNARRKKGKMQAWRQ